MRVITYGTFDLLHYGHINILENARSLGTELIVGLSTDNFNNEKGKNLPYFSFEDRRRMLSSLRCVDRIIPEDSWEQKPKDIIDLAIDIFVIGDDWRGKFDFLNTLCEVRYLPRTPEISTSKIKNDLGGRLMGG